MNTTNCVSCEQVYDNMKGKLMIDVKVPDNEVILTSINIKELDGLFNVSIVSDSTFIYTVKKKMKIYAEYGRKDNRQFAIDVNPDEFTHLMIEYDYYYYHNQIRVENARLKKLIHKTPEDIYKV